VLFAKRWRNRLFKSPRHLGPPAAPTEKASSPARLREIPDLTLVLSGSQCFLSSYESFRVAPRNGLSLVIEIGTAAEGVHAYKPCRFILKRVVWSFLHEYAIETPWLLLAYV